MIDYMKLMDIPDKVVTDLITKIVQKFKGKVHSFATLNLLALLDGFVDRILNKY